jgi:type III restriction enzyme
MSDLFFTDPILNSPYREPERHWELDKEGQPTQRIIDARRIADFVTPIPKAKKRVGQAEQRNLQLDEGHGLSSERQQYTASNINALRQKVAEWRRIPNPADWKVTPETARLLQHWRHFDFPSIRPFFCQVEAVETLIWLTEVAPKSGLSGKNFL